jgi:hypothetical protein
MIDNSVTDFLTGVNVLKLFGMTLKRIFGPNRQEITGGSRKVHYDEHRHFYASKINIRVIQLRRRNYRQNKTDFGN